jgi:Ras-related protein Rab-18
LLLLPGSTCLAAYPLLFPTNTAGKSSLLLRFTDDDFLSEEETTATIGVDFKVKSIDIDGRRYKLSIGVLGGLGLGRGVFTCAGAGAKTDITGHGRPGAFSHTNFELLSRRAGRDPRCVANEGYLHADLPVYDVSSRSSFDELVRWFRELDTYSSEDIVKIIVGNKVDKVRGDCLLLDVCLGVAPPVNVTLTPQENSRQVTTEEGQAFADRMETLFVGR